MILLMKQSKNGWKPKEKLTKPKLQEESLIYVFRLSVLVDQIHAHICGGEKDKNMLHHMFDLIGIHKPQKYSDHTYSFQMGMEH